MLRSVSRKPSLSGLPRGGQRSFAAQFARLDTQVSELPDAAWAASLRASVGLTQGR